MSATLLDTSSAVSASSTKAPNSPVSEGPTGAWSPKPRKWLPSPTATKPVGAKGNTFKYKFEDLHPRRTLVLCFDGTGDHYDNDNSNVVQLVSLLKKDDPTQQLVYYQTGIGTQGDSDGLLGKLESSGIGLRKAIKGLDLMLAFTLDCHVKDGYEFLCQNYQEGDVICIFGFSRGAYTARALAGMVQKVGVLPTWNRQMIPFAYQMFSKTDKSTVGLCNGFKKTFSIDAKIEFVGVWDTVASVGLVHKHLPFVSSNNCIRYFRHAVALDEHRVKFNPSYYRQSHDNDEKSKGVREELKQWVFKETAPFRHGLSLSDALTGLSRVLLTPLDIAMEARRVLLSPSALVDAGSALLPYLTATGKTSQNQKSLDAKSQEKANQNSGLTTDCKEVWFAGSHTDVGGGSVPNGTRNSLARIPLRWMIRECYKCQTGLIFDQFLLQTQVGMAISEEEGRPKNEPAPLQAGEYKILSGPTIRHRMEKAKEVCTTLMSNAMAMTPSRILNTSFDLLNNPARADVVAAAADQFLSDMKKLFPDLFPKDEAKEVDETTVPEVKEDMEELLDALSPIYDQLEFPSPWSLLELFPFKMRKEKALHSGADNFYSFKRLVNLGGGRKVFKHVVERGIKVHRSVKIRLEARDEYGVQSYVPLIRPNIAVEGGEKGERVCRTMKRQDWTSGADKWFSWEKDIIY